MTTKSLATRARPKPARPEPAPRVAGDLMARPPLGLPRGSVRALLTLLIVAVAVVIVEVLRGQAIDLLGLS